MYSRVRDLGVCVKIVKLLQLIPRCYRNPIRVDYPKIRTEYLIDVSVIQLEI